MRTFIALVAALGAVLSSPSGAQTIDATQEQDQSQSMDIANATIADTLAIYDSGDADLRAKIITTLTLISDGIMMANAEMKYRDGAGAGNVCMPGSLSLSGDQLLSLIKDEAKRHPPVLKADIVLGTYQSIHDAFPCGGSVQSQ